MSTSIYPSPSTVQQKVFSPQALESEFNIAVAGAAQSASPRSRAWANSPGKRAFDLVIATPGLVLSLPLLVLIAVAVKLSSKGPVLFRQVRMGVDQTPFTIYKYRTMRISEYPAPLVTRKGDPRMTQVGTILRKLKLDELPQLFNVLRGDMSLVGPRPKVIGHEQFELPCKPGITGVATLLFAREEDLLMHLPQESVETFTIQVLHPIKAQLDRHYADNGTFRSDLGILADTAFRLKRKKAISSLSDLSKWHTDSIDRYIRPS